MLQTFAVAYLSVAFPDLHQPGWKFPNTSFRQDGVGSYYAEIPIAGRRSQIKCPQRFPNLTPIKIFAEVTQKVLEVFIKQPTKFTKDWALPMKRINSWIIGSFSDVMDLLYTVSNLLYQQSIIGYVLLVNYAIQIVLNKHILSILFIQVFKFICKCK